MPVILSILGFVPNLIKGFFGLKTEQQNTLTKALEVIQDVNTSEKERAIAFAQYMAADSSSGYWLAACIRPLMALSLMILVGFWFFGIAPPNISSPMPPFIDKAVDALMVFMGVYVPGRSLEKIVTTLTTSKIVQAYLNKYI